MSHIPKIVNTRYILTGKFSSSSKSSTSSKVYSDKDNPALIINPKKFGRKYYSRSNVAKDLKKRKILNAQLDLNDSSQLVFIGETRGAANFYINPETNKPEFMLHPSAAKAWFKWRDEMKSKGISFRVSSAYRNYAHQNGLGSGSTVAKAGSSPHGFGGALDFSNLYSIVGGSGKPQNNAEGRKSKSYQDIARAGANHGWYNPWRLSDGKGLDEIWHFEYWGPL